MSEYVRRRIHEGQDGPEEFAQAQHEEWLAAMAEAARGGRCPHCGSTNGLKDLYRYNFAGHPPKPEEQFYRCPWSENVVLVACAECQTDATGYEPMSHDEVVAWLEEGDSG